MSVTLNAVDDGSAWSNVGVTTLSGTPITVAAGSNRVLLCILSTKGNPTGVSVTWDVGGSAQAMTSLGRAKQDTWDQWQEIFGLVVPATGLKTLTASWTGSMNAYLSSIAFNGASSASVAAAFDATLATGAWDANATVTLTTASGDATVSQAFIEGGSASVIPFTTYANRSIGGATVAAAYTLSAGTSDAHSYTNTNTQWGIVGVRVKQAVSSLARPPVVVPQALRRSSYY